MKFEKDWLQNAISRATYDIDLWPLPQQEYMVLGDRKFTPAQKVERTQTRIKRLREELAKEEANLIQLVKELELP